MKSSRGLIVAAMSVALLLGIISAAAMERGTEHKTRFTFARSVELPGGITLRPGKYTFRLADSADYRHIVEVLDEHELKTLATLLATDPLTESVVMFGDSPPAQPQPLRFWYLAGGASGKVGYEFVYPREQAKRIANATNQYLLTTDAPLNDIDAVKRAHVYTEHPRSLAAHRDTMFVPSGMALAPWVDFSRRLLFGALVVLLIAGLHHAVKTPHPTSLKRFVQKR